MAFSQLNVAVSFIILSIVGYYIQKLGKKGIYLNFVVPYATKFICSSWFRNTKFNLYRYINYIYHRNDRVLTYYHDIYDPHCIAMLHILPLIIKNYSIEIVPKITFNSQIERFGPKSHMFNIIDASIQSQYYKIPINLPLSHDHIHEKNTEMKRKLYLLCNSILAKYANGDILQFIDHALKISDILWNTNISLNKKYEQLLLKYDCDRLSEQETKQITQLCTNELRKRKHYLSGNIYFNSEWFPRVDRLIFLFQRLEPYTIGDIYDEQSKSIKFKNPFTISSLSLEGSDDLNLYFSFRSPYSYLVLERVYKLCDDNGLKLNIKPVLPSIFRKVTINPHKAMYIVFDCARIAELLEIEYGSIYDVGLDFKLIELCLKLFLYAKHKGKEREFTLEIAKYIWSRGKSIANVQNIKQIFKDSGDGELDYDEYVYEYESKYLNDNEHLKMVERNLEDLYNTGNWGVPSVEFKDRCVWGQDRLWALSQHHVEIFPYLNA